MRFLPVFLDLQAGRGAACRRGRTGAREIAPAGGRRCAHSLVRDRRRSRSRGSRVRTKRRGSSLRSGRSAGGRSCRRDRDSLRGRRRCRTGDVGAGQGGRPARQCDGRSRRIRPSSFRPSSIAAMSWSRSAPAARRRSWRAACASASKRCCPRGSAISPASSAAGARRSTAGFPNSRCAAASGSAWSMVRSARWCSPAAPTRPKRR